jgi:hypothetical protein
MATDRWRHQETKMKAFLGIVMAAALISPTQAAPTVAPPTSGASSIILVEGGCGHDYHRDNYGYCRPNWREWEPGWRACPPGWHLGSEGRRCWPN